MNVPYRTGARDRGRAGYDRGLADSGVEVRIIRLLNDECEKRPVRTR